MDTGLTIVRQKERRLWRWVVAFIIVGLMLISAWYAYSWYTKGTPLPLPIPVAKADPTIDESDVSPAAIDDYVVTGENPRYITIPPLGLGKTRIYPVGVTSQNLLDMPHNLHDAGWYKKSTLPGSGYGAVLISAHSTGPTKDGAFAKLDSLKPGDEIDIERGDGKTIAYSVVENKTMPLSDVSQTGMKMMMQSATPGKEGLNLMTEAGKWIPRLQVFDERVMLRAVVAD